MGSIIKVWEEKRDFLTSKISYKNTFMSEVLKTYFSLGYIPLWYICIGFLKLNYTNIILTSF